MKIKRFLLCFAALGLFLLLALNAEAARAGAMRGVELSLTLLIPSLLPFFAAANLLNRLGFASLLLRPLSPLLSAAFGVSAEGATAFVLGLTGGYPLGAATAADLLRRGRVSREEAQRLLCFCDNTGPAFALGALGLGAFGSAGAGALLYLVHALSAVLLGLLLRRGGAPSRLPAPAETGDTLSPAEAFTESVRAAGGAVLGVCAFVAVFSSLLAVLEALGVLHALCAALALRTPFGMSWWRAALYALLELSGAVGAMAGLSPAPANLALAAFALSWGGLCVHFQGMGVTAGTGLNSTKRLGGKLLQGVLSAGLAYLLAPLFFPQP